MIWTIVDTWIVVDIILVGVSATVIGLHLVLRKESLLGDGISHAVLPGIALGYIITQSRESIVLLIGAVVMGIITAVLTEYIAHNRKIDESASLGVVFSGLFALGLLLMASIASTVDLDPSCVLFGAVELTPLDTFTIMKYEIPRAVVFNGTVLLLNIAVFCVIYKKLNTSVFDPSFAKTIGIKVSFIRYVHIILVAITTVVAFESVGSILILTLLVVPQVIGLLLSHKMRFVLFFSIIAVISASVLGHIGAVVIPSMVGLRDTNTVGSISVVLGMMLFLAVLFSPQGIVPKQLHLFIHQYGIAKDDILKSLFHSHIQKLSVKNIRELVAPSLLTGRINMFAMVIAKRYLLLKRCIEYTNGEFFCTEIGKGYAQNIQTTHRRWEDYLYQNIDIHPERIHNVAEQMEHIKTKSILSHLKEEASDVSKIPGHSHERKDE